MDKERSFKPEGYVQIPYQPVKMVETEAKLAELEQTKLQFSYTYWVMIWE